MSLTYKSLSTAFSEVVGLDEEPNGALSKKIGGKVAANINNGTFTHCCTVKMSYAFNYGGSPVPKNTYGQTSSGADNKWYHFRVLDMQKFVKATTGKDPVTGSAKKDFIGKKGVIFFIGGAPFPTCTGHVDLFDGSEVVGAGYFNADTVELYEIDDETSKE